ncbi:DUF2945 domain-containing protein [Streptomyces sp. NPDC047928]|uniref:DUF2945 domain-containing protein n=1 Tax=unclassified Streptomyces TaxID=2593676 RepID=UPI00371366D0
MAKRAKFHKGDHVTWKSHGRTVGGSVKREISDRRKAAGRTVAASPQEPQYEVESDRTGRSAVHRPESLRRKGGGA